jgi:hypothetical protein
MPSSRSALVKAGKASKRAMAMSRARALPGRRALNNAGISYSFASCMAAQSTEGCSGSTPMPRTEAFGCVQTKSVLPGANTPFKAGAPWLVGTLTATGRRTPGNAYLAPTGYLPHAVSSLSMVRRARTSGVMSYF